MDQLVGLREKLTFPYPAAPALQIIAEAEFLPARIMIAYLRAHDLDIVELTKIERTPPDEWPNAGEEIFAKFAVSRRCARADESCLLPRKRARFIIADGGFNRQGNRADFGRWAQPHIDAKDIAIFIDAVEQINHAFADVDRAFLRIIAVPAGQRIGIIQEYRVDIGAIIELAPTMFAQSDNRKALRRRARHALLDGGCKSYVEREHRQNRKARA